jgi:dUTP pyrophosphatase
MKFIKLSHEGIIPTRATKGSAGYDLSSKEDYALAPGERRLFKTGIGWVDIPDFIVGDIRPRSGLAYKHGIDTLAGVIDADYYKADIGVILINHGDFSYTIRKGDRIAQLVLRQVMTMGDTPMSERNGGYGSTGE